MSKGKAPANKLWLAGRRFGRLVAERQVGHFKNGMACWLCTCDCGLTLLVRSSQLKNGNTKSCGCLRKETASLRSRKRPYEALYNKVLGRCKRIGREFSLTFEEFLEFVDVKVCHYCGDPIIWTPHRLGYKRNYVGCNLDRKDSSLGYTKKNCLVCCFPCNMMKQSSSYSDFMERVVKIHGRHNQ